MIIGQYSNNNVGTLHILVSMWGYSNTNGVLRIKCGTQNSIRVFNSIRILKCQ